MSFTTEEIIKLLEGEIETANALAKTLKIAIEQKIIDREDVQQSCLELIEDWFAIHEQRILAQKTDNPMHIFN